jgi:hypothetical protein
MALVPASKVSEMAFGTPKAMREARGLQDAENTRGTTLMTQAQGADAGYVIYVYNILAGFEHPVINQPPDFSAFKIPVCPRGQKFSYTTLPAFTKTKFNKPGTTEYYYTNRDGREAANSLLNPDAHPGNPWGAQLSESTAFGNNDMTGVNRNSFGVFWSLTKPDDPKLEEEIKLFRKRCDKTMRGLVDEGNTLNASNDRKAITPLMHFAMEYFHLEAEWHRSHEHRVPCPNCGEPVREGIAYHKNEFGDRCIIDRERYEASIEHAKPARVEAAEEEEEPIAAGLAKRKAPRKAPTA